MAGQYDGRLLKTPADGYLSFEDMITPGEPAVFYALVIFNHPNETSNTHDRI